MQFLSVLPLEFQEDLKEFLLNADVDDNVKTLKICDVKEYDKVELIVEKEVYAKDGVHKGMIGMVISEYAINDKWQIIFSGKKDIDIDISVNREDFKVIE